MSGFERILARVNSDALRECCTSAIENELKNLHEKMETYLASLDKAFELQDAIQKLDVPLSPTNIELISGIQNKYQAFSNDFKRFQEDQMNYKTSTTVATTMPLRNDAQHQLSNLTNNIQQRLATKHINVAWVSESIKDIEQISNLLCTFTPGPEQQQAIVLVLDHFVSAVLLSPTVVATDLVCLDKTLRLFPSTLSHVSAFCASSTAVILSKLRAVRVQPPRELSSNVHLTSTENPPLDAQVPELSDRNDSLDDIKKQYDEEDQQSIFVKVEKPVEKTTHSSSDTIYEVYVSDLPWGAQQHEIESYFGIAGPILSVRMPTMDDGSTVGVAIIRFVSIDGMRAALRMDGYYFQGKTIHIAAHSE